MKPDAVFNRYDIRGDYPDEIDEEFARRLGAAVGTHARRGGRGRVVVGRDTRDASGAVHAPFIDGVRGTGANVVDVGTGPTDKAALAASQYGGIGVMITASHHAWDRTGFKLLYEEGNGFSNEDVAAIEERFRAADHETGEGNVLDVEHEFDEIYIETVTEAAEAFIDGGDTTVVLDALGGTHRLAPAVFDELGVGVVEHDHGGTPDPAPSAASRSDVADTLQESGADLAVGYDPDGDRVYLIHPDHGWIDGDRIFYLLARLVEPEQIVASIDTSPLLEEAGADITYTRVGDIFVSAEGRAIDADLLGEPNGHYAVPRFCWYNSGIFCSLLLASAAGRIPDLLEPVEAYSTYRSARTYADSEERDAALSAVKKTVAEHYEVVSTLDGVKFRDDEITGLVRPSGTSPKIRLILHGTGDMAGRGEELEEKLLG